MSVVVPRAYYTHFIRIRFDIRITTHLTWPIMHKHTSNSGHWSSRVAYFTDARKQQEENKSWIKSEEKRIRSLCFSSWKFICFFFSLIPSAVDDSCWVVVMHSKVLSSTQINTNSQIEITGWWQIYFFLESSNIVCWNRSTLTIYAYSCLCVLWIEKI